MLGRRGAMRQEPTSAPLRFSTGVNRRLLPRPSWGDSPCGRSGTCDISLFDLHHHFDKFLFSVLIVLTLIRFTLWQVRNGWPFLPLFTLSSWRFFVFCIEFSDIDEVLPVAGQECVTFSYWSSFISSFWCFLLSAMTVLTPRRFTLQQVSWQCNHAVTQWLHAQLLIKHSMVSTYITAAPFGVMTRTCSAWWARQHPMAAWSWPGCLDMILLLLITHVGFLRAVYEPVLQSNDCIHRHSAC